MIVTYISFLRNDCMAVHQFVGLFDTQQTQMTDRNRTSATDYFVILQGDEILLLAALIFTEVDILRFLTHELMHSYSGEGECIRDCNLQSQIHSVGIHDSRITKAGSYLCTDLIQRAKITELSYCTLSHTVRHNQF
jgi:hypothetical protein